MFPSSTHDTPSPKSAVPAEPKQDGRMEIPDSQQASPGASPGPVRRPSFEQLDPEEVAKAVAIADSLKKMRPYTEDKKLRIEKPPPPPPAEFIPRPPLVPFSGNSNPDAAALRATASILQMQKAKATRDIQTLERLKELANKDPVEFVKQLSSQKIKQEAHPGGTLGPTLGPGLDSLLQSLGIEEPEAPKKEIPDTQESDDEDITSASSSFAQESESGSKFPDIPVPQNIARMPPINWAKYGIVGESLDKLHEEQRTYPSQSQPERLVSRDAQPAQPIQDQYQQSGERAAPYAIAVPYDPLKDAASDSRRGSKKPL